MLFSSVTDKRQRQAWIALLLVAVLVRLALILACDPGLRNDSDGHLGPNFVPLSYRTLTLGLFNGDLSADVGARSPGYPMLMAISYRLFGVDNFEAIVWLQFFLGLGIFFASFKLWSQLYGKGWAALLATAMTTLEPALVLAEDQILSETLTVFLLVSSLALIIHAVRCERPSASAAALAGLCVAWLALTRPAFQLIIPVYALYLAIAWRKNWKERGVIVAMLAFLTVSLLPVLGWNAFNQQRFGYFTLMTTQGYILSTHTIPLIDGEPDRYGDLADVAKIVDDYGHKTEGQAIWLAYPDILEKRQVSFVEGSRLMQELSVRVVKDRLFGYIRSVFHAVAGFWESRLDALDEFDKAILFRLLTAGYDLAHKLGVAVFFLVVAMDIIRPRRWLEPLVMERMLMLGIVLFVCASSTIPIAVENARYKIPVHPLLWGIAVGSLVMNWQACRNFFEKWR